MAKQKEKRDHRDDRRRAIGSQSNAQQALAMPAAMSRKNRTWRRDQDANHRRPSCDGPRIAYIPAQGLRQRSEGGGPVRPEQVAREPASVQNVGIPPQRQRDQVENGHEREKRRWNQDGPDSDLA